MTNNLTENQLFGEVKSDSKGRLTLVSVVEANKSYRVSRNDSGQIILDPLPVHERELRILNDPAKLASLKRGIEQAEAGETRSLGSFKKYASK